MSSFAFETINMIDVREFATAAADVILNVGASLGAILLGRAAVSLLLGLG
jgi:fluoride ion exporter CrcB/FEX